MKILIAAGGTGGHVYPAIAIANELNYRYPDWEIEFLGTYNSMEDTAVPNAGYKINLIDLWPFERFFGLKDKLITVKKLLRSMKSCRKIIKEFSPDIVIGTGGYVCGPSVLTAHLMKLPTLIAEQNVIPGFTIKTLSKYADRVCLSFVEAQEYMHRKDNCVVTGNPVRKDFELYTKELSRKSLKLNKIDRMVLIFGGSLGAKSIDEATLGLIERYKGNENVFIYLITGEEWYDYVMNELSDKRININNKNVCIMKYSDNMPLLMNAADLIICRSGATTMAEVNYLGIPAIYIPYPHAANDHQTINANASVKKYAAKTIKDCELDEKKLYDTVESIIYNEDMMKTMSEQARKMGRREAAALLCDNIEDVLKLHKP